MEPWMNCFVYEEFVPLRGSVGQLKSRGYGAVDELFRLRGIMTNRKPSEPDSAVRTPENVVRVKSKSSHRRWSMVNHWNCHYWASEKLRVRAAIVGGRW
ncbi:hypothetical protein QE152_g8444 [Popillia japonica]|uniref:Uncharacterized protein n=1 Tax=Popillia japonica TaxID=7064 RepID=A0AAW1MC41_POPJA